MGNSNEETVMIQTGRLGDQVGDDGGYSSEKC